MTPGINCCVSSEPRGISMIPALAGGQRGNGVAVVLYAPGQIAGKAATIETTTDYPMSGAVNLIVRPDRASSSFPVYLRVPEWTRSYTATAAGQTHQGRPGEWLTIERPWKAGDTITVQMDMTVQVLDGSPTYNRSVAIQRGPQVLALEEELNPMVASMDTAGPAEGAAGFKSVAEKLPVTWIGKQAYSIPGPEGRDLVLVPFADAKSYRIWLMQPDARMSHSPIRVITGGGWESPPHRMQETRPLAHGRGSECVYGPRMEFLCFRFPVRAKLRTPDPSTSRSYSSE